MRIFGRTTDAWKPIAVTLFDMRTLRFGAVALFVAAVPVFLIATNVRWVINAPVLYSYGFDKYDVPAYTGIERDELLSAARQIRDYFNNDEEFLTVSVVWRGTRIENLYDDREVLHMKDVKGLVRGVYRISDVAAGYLVAFAAVGLLVWRGKFVPRLARYAGMGGMLTLGLVVLAGIGSLVGFERLFLAFHLVSFSNDLWLLDPRTSYLLAMFPEGFFFDATMWIVGSTVVGAALLTAPAAVLWWRPRSGRRAARRPAASRQGAKV
jgi:integral membrane protein (TIGR01906 family)